MYSYHNYAKNRSIKCTAFCKCTAHTRSGKILFMEIQVTAGYCCERLPCIQIETMELPGASAVKGYHVFVLHVVC